MYVADDPIDTGKQYPICKFAASGDAPILRQAPATIEEWKDNVNACMALVEKKLDAIEKRIRDKGE